MIFDDKVLCVGDVGLLRDAVLVLADEEVLDMFLKSEFGWARHSYLIEPVAGFGRILMYLILPSIEITRGVPVLAASSRARLPARRNADSTPLSFPLLLVSVRCFMT